MEFEEIRKQLMAELEEPRLREGLWKDLVHSRNVELVANGKWTIQMLARLYRRREEDLFPPPRSRREKVAEIAPDARAVALNQIVARRAAGLWGVYSFRRTVLAGQLIEASEIPAWIEQQAQREGPPAAHYVSVPVPDWDLEWLIEQDSAAYADWLERTAHRLRSDAASERPPQMTTGPQCLDYFAPDSPAKSIPIRSDGVLGTLKSAVARSDGLCETTGWPEHHAVAFVLSGWRPPMPKGAVRIHFGLCPAAATIETRANPRLAPKQVGELYNKARTRFIGGRDKPMDAKHLALAIFTEEMRSSERSWAELRVVWNSRHRKWRFPAKDDAQARRFALEARTAWQRVTGERWKPQGRRTGRSQVTDVQEHQP